MKYFKILYTNGSHTDLPEVIAYQEIQGDNVLVRVLDESGNILDTDNLCNIGLTECRITDLNPPFPEWGIPDA